MEIDGVEINENNTPYIIGELSANHGGSIERAKKSIEMAAASGVSAVKIQTYTPDTMTIDSTSNDFIVEQGLWAGRTLYELYTEAYTPFEWHEDLFFHAKKHGVTLFSTPFDESAVDLLESLSAPAYKVASFEITDIPLIKYIASKKKPILMSTGMASKREVEEAVNAVRATSDSELLLFHCVSSYPTATKESNLSNIVWLRDKYGVPVGLSDHTTTNTASVTAIGMGAVAIEKHFKLDEADCGPDASFSLTIEQLGGLVSECSEAWVAKGSVGFSRTDSERLNTVFRRSLYFVRNLREGEVISPDDIRRIRPGYGMAPKHYEAIIGRKVKTDVSRGDAVTKDNVVL